MKASLWKKGHDGGVGTSERHNPAESRRHGCYFIPRKPGSSLALQISSQHLSCSQLGSGFGIVFSKPTPPVIKKMKSVYLISLLALDVKIKKEKSCVVLI